MRHISSYYLPPGWTCSYLNCYTFNYLFFINQAPNLLTKEPLNSLQTWIYFMQKCETWSITYVFLDHWSTSYKQKIFILCLIRTARPKGTMKTHGPGFHHVCWKRSLGPRVILQISNLRHVLWPVHNSLECCFSGEIYVICNDILWTRLCKLPIH